MKTPRLLWTLLGLNVAFLALQLLRAQPADPVPPPAPIIRCQALELVDAQGRVRAELKVLPAQPDLKLPDGTVGYPETVLLRLVNSRGLPHVKISATEDGAGAVFGSNGGHVQILSRGETPKVTLTDKSGRERVLKP